MRGKIKEILFIKVTVFLPFSTANTVRNTRRTALCWMRGKIKEILFIKVTVFLPFSFRKKISFCAASSTVTIDFKFADIKLESSEA